MAHTGLVDLLRRATAISAVAARSGEPIAEAVAREIKLRRESSRRSFLRQTLTATSALVLAACALCALFARQ